MSYAKTLVTFFCPLTQYFITLHALSCWLASHTYRIQLRLVSIWTLLAHGYEAVSVANETSFFDQSHFTQQFQRYFLQEQYMQHVHFSKELIRPLIRGTLRNPLAALAVYVLIVLGTPIVLGLLAARFVRRPLRQFKEAIASLEQSNYQVQLRSMGIREFDEVFTKFNDLINRLWHEEKLRKNLISDTSHELNTPLTTMIGQLTAMQEGKYPLTQERVAILKEQAERLAELVQQLDAYTKARMPDTGEPEDIHLRQFCEELIHHFSLELKQKGITAKLHIAEGSIIHANCGALQQILTNLMQNTLRYSQATEVTIEATAHKLLFSDNGKGVPAKSLPYLFERFYRVDTSRSRATGGLGLGLAIVRELAESQGWAITAVAGHPGLTFVLKL